MKLRFLAMFVVLAMAFAGCSSSEKNDSNSDSSALDTTVVDTIGTGGGENTGKGTDSTRYGKDTSEVISTGSVPAG